MLNDFTVVDLETTGLDPVAGRITEIAARRYRNGELVNHFEHLVWGGLDVPEGVAKKTGITTEMVHGFGLDECDALRALFHVVHGSVLVAHNAAFEMSWLHQACLRVFGKPFGADFLCTKTLAATVMPDLLSYSLGFLTETLGIVWTGPQHRALPDVVATEELLRLLRGYADRREFDVATLLNCCGANRDGRGAHYPLPAGLPAHAKEVKQ